MGFSGPIHTWSNGRVHERLDRCVVNKMWDLSIHDMSLWHLNKLKSDQRPIFLKIKDPNGTHSNRMPIFRFQSAWLTDDSFKEVVKGAWRNGSDWHDGSNNF